jgi:hypothetical protein
MPSGSECLNQALYFVTLNVADRQCIAPKKGGARCRNTVPKDIDQIKSWMKLASATNDRQTITAALKNVVLLRLCRAKHRPKLKDSLDVWDYVTSKYVDSFTKFDPNCGLSTPPTTPPRTSSSSPASDSAEPVPAHRYETRSKVFVPPRATFTEYKTRQNQTNTLNSKLRASVSTKFPKGDVYVFAWESEPEFLKIGFSGKSWESRFDEWEAHHPGLAHVCSISVPFPQRIERLIHLELRSFRQLLTNCQGEDPSNPCLVGHTEWFKIDEAKAKCTLKAWEKIIKRRALYTDLGHLDEWWAAQLKNHSNEHNSEFLTSLLDESDRLAAEEGRLPHQGTLVAEAERLDQAKRLDEVIHLDDVARLASQVERLTGVMDRLTEDNRLFTEERRVADRLRQDREVDIQRLTEQVRRTEGYRAAEQARTTGGAQLEDQGVTVPDDSSATEAAPISTQLPRDASPAVPNIPYIVTPPATPQRHISIPPTGAGCIPARETDHETNVSQSDDPFSQAFHANHGSVDATEASPSAEQRFLSLLTPPATPLRHNTVASASAVEVSPLVGQKGSLLLTLPETPLSDKTVSPISADRTSSKEPHREENSDQSEAPVPSLVQAEASSAAAVNAGSNQSLKDDPDATLQAFSDPFGILVGADAEAETAAAATAVVATAAAATTLAATAAVATAAVMTTTTTTTGGVPALAALALRATPPTTTDGDAPSSTPFTLAAAPSTVAF